MSRTFLFGGSQSSSSSNSSYLVQFKAGKMTQSGSTVTPVKEKKGLLYLYQTPEDMLMHFCWKDRTSGAVEDDLIVFPDEVEFLKVPQCTTGRVFVLKFKTSSRRLFFWSQESKSDKDDDYVSKINEYLNNPPTSRSGSGGGTGTDLSSVDNELRNLLSGSDPSAQQHLMNLLGNVRGFSSSSQLSGLLGSVAAGARSSGGSSGAGSGASSAIPTPKAPNPSPGATSLTASGATTTSGGSNSSTASASPASASGAPSGVLLSQLQSVIQDYQQRQPSEQPAVNVDLATSLNYDALKPLLENEAFMASVREHLPATGETAPLAQQFSSTVQSPQFRQALNAFSAALQSAQLGPLMQQFGLPDECIAAATAGNMEAFLKAFQDKAARDAACSAEEGAKKKDEQEDMALD